jgi:amidase
LCAGSTIRPASFTGVYSFKPTFGSVCHEGIKSFSPSNDTIGFFARSIADLQLLTRAVHLVDDDFVPSPRTRPLRIAICKTTMWSLAEQPTIDALAAAEALLVASGAEVTHLTLPAPFSHLVPLQTIIMSSEARASNLVAHLLATSLPAAPDGSAWMHEDLSKLVLNRIPRTQLLAALDHIATLRPLLDSLILQGSYDSLLCPSAPGVAPKVEDGTGDPRFCTGWTILHVPVINVPFPVGAGKLPVGLSLVGSRYGDTKLLEIAQRVDQIFRPTA